MGDRHGSNGVVVLPPSNRRTNGKTDRDRLIEGEMMLRDRALGLTQAQLCDKYGLSRPAVRRRLEDALAARIAPTVDMYRAQQNDLLDVSSTRAAETIEQAEQMIALGQAKESVDLIERGMRLRLEGVKALLAIIDRRSKLNGLDAPVKVEATVTEVTQTDIGLQEMIREARAKASQ